MSGVSIMLSARFMSALLVLVLVGCEGTSLEKEASFDKQLEEVQAGRKNVIEVTQSAVPQESLKQLEGLTGLVQLRLDKTRFDDQSAKVIAGIESLKVVNLPQSQLTDDGIAEICTLPNLQLLRVGSPSVTDQAIEQIANCLTIKYLHLLDSPITDQSIPAIASMEQLESFYADGTNLTEEGVSKLVTERSDLHVHFNNLHPPEHDAGHSH